MKDTVLILIFLFYALFSSAQMKTESFSVEKKISWLVYTPENYSSDGEASPLLLFLHGGGERGNDLSKVKKWGPPRIIEEGGKLPFVVVAPQCPEGQFWDVYLLKELLDTVLASCNIDKTRIYLTGVSLGGFGTWALASMYPEYFAAIAPICGSAEPLMVKWKLKEMPVWVFHGAKDKTVPEWTSASLVNILKETGNDVKYTCLPEGGHADTWIYAYYQAGLWDWMLQHQKKAKKRMSKN